MNFSKKRVTLIINHTCKPHIKYHGITVFGYIFLQVPQKTVHFLDSQE